ncbi:hypothetical protein H072_7733 [Dactylellina haptotyla CBS 200.50]|uniref:Uncharacterized protein n=1 Tax=Dactylellina haptotyla (strain CBS 200.50) TaxID=1284197 RepID=S8BGS1_DACHA|nr:hypothetical protein H072_7733 [Dactylellina haptotyla CBS 200.50]
MKVSFVIISAALVATSQALALIDPVRINACKRPIDEGCKELCKKCMPSGNPPPSVNKCFDTNNFDTLCIPPPKKASVPKKNANIDCDRVQTKDAAEASDAECKVLCTFAKRSGNWEEFESNCKSR